MTKIFWYGTIWATSWQNQQNGMCAIHPVWSESLLSVWRHIGSSISYPLSALRRLIRLGVSEPSLDAQSFCWFCHEAAHFSLKQRIQELVWVAIQIQKIGTPKNIWTPENIRVMHLKDANKIAYSVDPAQTSPSVWSGSSVFTQWNRWGYLRTS